MNIEDEETRLRFHKLPTDLQVDIMEFSEAMADHGLQMHIVDMAEPAGSPSAPVGLEIVIRIAD